ncbi:histidine kinase [Limibacter armeniacum]|uniref:sensor histidine kinase n=1 Tax=Limibacter armeniacum TaxID=466084 RepID=UPI002FE61AD8
MHKLDAKEGYKRNTELLIHLAIWLVVFSAPLIFLSSSEMGGLSIRSARRWIPLFLYPVLFYVNYLVLVPKLLFKKRHYAYMAGVFLLVVLGIWGEAILAHVIWLLDDTKPMREPRWPRPDFPFPVQLRVERLVRQVLAFVTMIGLSTAIRVTYRWFADEKAREELEQQRLHSELSLLKNQLNPHFFFNTLNNIYALIAVRPDDAQKAVHKLSKLMRYQLYEADTVLVGLKDELQFLQTYIDLMSLRITKDVELVVSLPSVGNQVKIPPLLFVTLVENSFKHGVSYTEESYIRVDCDIKGGKVVFETANSKPQKPQENKEASGIGMQNIQKRLNLLYPNNYTFDVIETDKSYIVRLEIPVQTEHRF